MLCSLPKLSSHNKKFLCLWLRKLSFSYFNVIKTLIVKNFLFCYVLSVFRDVQTLSDLLYNITPIRQRPQHIYVWLRLFLLRCKTLHFPLLNSMRFLSMHISSLLKSPWMSGQPSCDLVTPPSFGSSANLLETRPCTITQLDNKYFEQDWTQYTGLDPGVYC